MTASARTRGCTVAGCTGAPTPGNLAVRGWRCRARTNVAPHAYRGGSRGRGGDPERSRREADGRILVRHASRSSPIFTHPRLRSELVARPWCSHGARAWLTKASLACAMRERYFPPVRAAVALDSPLIITRCPSAPGTSEASGSRSASRSSMSAPTSSTCACIMGLASPAPILTSSTGKTKRLSWLRPRDCPSVGIYRERHSVSDDRVSHVDSLPSTAFASH